MKVEIAIAKGLAEDADYRPCWIRINDKEYCVVNWGGRLGKSHPHSYKAEFSPDEFEVVNLLDYLKVKK